MGLRQRLSLAVAVLHEPKMLILDEPTSGVDPVARDSFWELLVELSRKEGVTIFVTTHFMNEGMRCDRISLMHAGRVLACDAPQKLIEARGAASLEDAFIGYMEDAIAESAPAGGAAPEPPAEPPRRRRPRASAPPPAARASAMPLPLRRMLAYSRNEAIQILRDPVRLAFAFVGSALLMLVFGFGITTDVEHIRWARVRSRSVAREPRLPRAVPRRAALLPRHGADLLRRRSAAAPAVGRRLAGRSRCRRASAATSAPRRQPRGVRQVDGAMPFRAETVAQYVRGVNSKYLQRSRQRARRAAPEAHRATSKNRFMYNPTFESIYSIVPSVPALLLILIPAILMTVSIVREKELGSIINFYVTPTGRLEYLLGKQLPYVAIGMINFFILAGDRARGLRRLDQGQLSPPDPVHAALPARDDRRRHGDVDVHQDAGRGRVHHRHPDDAADHPVRRPVAAGLDAGGRRAKSSARSGRRPTTCTRASARTPRALAAASCCATSSSWRAPSRSSCASASFGLKKQEK